MTISVQHPDVCLGMPLYNSERYVAEAVESLLSQTYGDFKIIAVDDCSTDNTGNIVRNYASADNRVIYIRNEKRLGLIMNKRKTFSLAKKRNAEYFAWTADHDVWDPDWLREHVNVLNDHHDVVLAYPLTTAIDNKGRKIAKKPTEFETVNMSKKERIRSTCLGVEGAGNMIYGLFRSEALENCGILPAVSLPDRLLMLHLSVYGTFKQLKKRLWFRRYPGASNNRIAYNYETMVLRQHVTLFPGKKVPWHSYFPTIEHVFGLIYYLIVKSFPGNFGNAFWGPYMALLYLQRKKHLLAREYHLFRIRRTKLTKQM